MPETISVKIKTTFSALTHLSPTLTFTITCGSYGVNSDLSVSNTQYKEHGASANEGFDLPVYTTTQQAGCPVDKREVSSSNLGVFSISALNSGNTLLVSTTIVRPTDNT